MMAPLLTLPLHATVCFVCTRGKVLLPRRAAGRLWAGRLNGPGGKIAPGESAAAAIVREVGEETGLCIDAPRPAGLLELRFGDPRVQIPPSRLSEESALQRLSLWAFSSTRPCCELML
jgi:8-oxo-dGTP pyrophosphatase MutT (NUDIX family)